MAQPLRSLPSEIKNAPLVVPTRRVMRVEDIIFSLAIRNNDSAIYNWGKLEQYATAQWNPSGNFGSFTASLIEDDGPVCPLYPNTDHPCVLDLRE